MLDHDTLVALEREAVALQRALDELPLDVAEGDLGQAMTDRQCDVVADWEQRTGEEFPWFAPARRRADWNAV